MAVAGGILHVTERNYPLMGFMIIFILALLCRLLCLNFMLMMHEPSQQVTEEDQFTFIQFFRRFRHSNFAKFVLFVSLMNFSVNLAAPYFAVLMIRDLSFNYFIYTLIIIAAPLALYATIQRWGRHADLVGNLKIIRLTAILISFIPVWWILYQHPVYLIGVEMFSGFLWAGFNLCTVNFIYDAVTPAKRTRCIAYFNVVNGTALALGALLGGFLVKHLPPLHGYPLLCLFLISSLSRLTVAIFLPRFLKEVRHVKEAKSVDIFFSMIRMRPMLGVDHRSARMP